MCVHFADRAQVYAGPLSGGAYVFGLLNRGATNATHNLGGLHADVHHATMCGQWVTPEQLDNRTWECLLGKHRTDEPIQPLKL